MAALDLYWLDEDTHGERVVGEVVAKTLMSGHVDFAREVVVVVDHRPRGCREAQSWGSQAAETD